jgi:hypothetical protein
MTRALLALVVPAFLSAGTLATTASRNPERTSTFALDDCTNCLECTGGQTYHRDESPPSPLGQVYPFWNNHVDCVNWSCGAQHDDCPAEFGPPAAALVARAISGGGVGVEGLVRESSGRIRVVGGALQVLDCGNRVYANLPLDLLLAGTMAE